jgi:hypothetical protein
VDAKVIKSDPECISVPKILNNQTDITYLVIKMQLSLKNVHRRQQLLHRCSKHGSATHCLRIGTVYVSCPEGS